MNTVLIKIQLLKKSRFPLFHMRNIELEDLLNDWCILLNWKF